MFNVQKENFKNERKWFTLSHFMKSMSLTHELKDFLHYLLEILVRLSLKCEIKSIRK